MLIYNTQIENDDEIQSMIIGNDYLMIENEYSKTLLLYILNIVCIALTRRIQNS